MRVFFAVLDAEMRQLLRDINTLLFSVLTPLFVFPLMLFLFSQGQALVDGWEESLVPRVVVPDALAAELPATVVRVDGPDADAHVTLEGAVVNVTFRSGDAVSELARRRLVKALDEPWDIDNHDVAPDKEALASVLAQLLPGLLVTFAVVASMYPAMEAVVADRERGTLETTLVTAAPRWVFVAGKLVTVGLITLLSMGGTLVGALVTLFHLAFLLDAPIGLPPGRLLALLPLAALTALAGAAISLVAAAPTRSFKQAQNTSSTAAAVVMVLALLGMLPRAELGPELGLVPITNAVLAMRQVLLGHAIGPWGVVAVAELVVIGLVAGGWAARTLSKEELR
ncbi:MAG: hypothetical protein EXR71_06240 [Myxococcales bacterium]|nr:hypothetical protein [Myxococcales bacterium]